MTRTLITIAFWILVIATSLAQSPDSVRISNRHDFIAVGPNYKELGIGDYIAVATTTTEEDAKKLIKEYKKLKVQEPKYGYVSGKSLWFICFSGEVDIERTIQKRDELRKTKIFKDAWLITIHENPKSDVLAMCHEFVARKDNNDTAVGDYVIVAVFKNEANAKHMTEELKKLDYDEMGYGYLASKNQWFVFSGPFHEINQAKTERDKYRQLKMFKDAWLLTVHQ